MRAFPALLLLSASTAYAQAPGDYEPAAEAPPPPPAHVYAAPPAHDPWALMANRWSIGFSVGQTKVKVNDGDPSSFATGELAVRYRLRPEWEAELTLGGGDEKDQMSGASGTHTFTTATIGLRYRLRPTEHFNGFLMAGVGASAVTLKDASSDDQDNATRGHFVIGGGLEYRFVHFALQAELRYYAMGAASSDEQVREIGPNGPWVDSSMNDGHASAGTMTLGASYYF